MSCSWPGCDRPGVKLPIGPDHPGAGAELLDTPLYRRPQLAEIEACDEHRELVQMRILEHQPRRARLRERRP